MSLDDAMNAKVEAIEEAEIRKHEKCELDTTGEKGVLVSVDREINTAEDALDRAEVDQDIWEVERQVINSWSVAMNGPPVKYVELWQVKLWLRRKAPQLVQDGIRAFLNELKSEGVKTPKPKRRKRNDGHLLEVSLYDSHFGKYCWGDETGTDFDTDIARGIYRNAVDDLLDRVDSYKVDRILFPVGNDFFHVNNWENTTQRGTAVDHDGRFPRVYQTGKWAVIHAINRCLEVAPVDVVYVPGNHDPHTSFYLCDTLNSFYSGNQHVSVDMTPTSRKPVTWGEVLILLDHGQLKPQDYIALCATENPELWGRARWREAHVGHNHRKKELRTVDVNEEMGFRHRVIPSLSGTDKWHFDKGFVCSHRCAEAYLWHREEWYVGHFSVNVRE